MSEKEFTGESPVRDKVENFVSHERDEELYKEAEELARQLPEKCVTRKLVDSIDFLVEPYRGREISELRTWCKKPEKWMSRHPKFMNALAEAGKKYSNEELPTFLRHFFADCWFSGKVTKTGDEE